MPHYSLNCVIETVNTLTSNRFNMKILCMILEDQGLSIYEKVQKAYHQRVFVYFSSMNGRQGISMAIDHGCKRRPTTTCPIHKMITNCKQRFMA